MANELLPEEEKELERLLQQHPEASYIKEMLMHPWKDRERLFGPEEVDMALRRHKLRLEAAGDADDEPVPVRPKGKVRRMVLQLTGVAAAVALAFFVGRQWLPAANSPLEGAPQQLVTQKGSRSHIKLPDGTTVWLNAGSKLDYPKQFTGGKREVTLEGEAFFDVAKDADRPFTVRTKTFAIRVLGTEFNVRAYPQEDSAVTSLIRGAVEVVLDETENRVVRLRPNEKLTMLTAVVTPDNNGHNPVEIHQPVKSRLTEVEDSVIAETAWVENKLAFKKMPLERVAVLLEHWFDADIRFKNDNKRQVYLSGVFDKESLIEVLKALELTGSFHFRQGDDGVIWIE
ncbi:FecR family protein [Chitinophaga lutea]|nr:FecR domain-containing protein [Chitinophaga lutea]